MFHISSVMFVFVNAFNTNLPDLCFLILRKDHVNELELNNGCKNRLLSQLRDEPVLIH